MTDKQLHRLNRAALIQLLIEQTEENQALLDRVDELEKKLKSKAIAVSTAGSMADAAMELNNVFSSADKAAQQYLENLRDANKKSEAIIAEAKRQAERIVSEAKAEALRLGIQPEPETAPPAPSAGDRPKRKDAERARKPEQKAAAPKKPTAGQHSPKPAGKTARKAGGELDDLFENAFSEMRKNNR